MDIVNSIHFQIRKMLKKQSKIDGRFLVVAALLGYFGLLYLANFFVPYREFWRKLGGEHPSFAMSKNTQAISPLR